MIVGLALLEAASRILLPVSLGARNLSLVDEPISPLMDDQIRMKPGLVYRQVSNEFDVRVTIDNYGNRTTGLSGEPEVVFLGDSFTFGHGLRDDQTFASIYCESKKLTCSNMGRSGTGTGGQLNILEHYLKTEAWRPRELKLFVLAMTNSLLPGNDLFDNYYARPQALERDISQAGVAPPIEYQVTAAFRMLEVRRVFLKWSNFARGVYYTIGPWMRTIFAPDPEREILRDSLVITKIQFARLENLAKQYGFDYKIYIIHPAQDILRNTSSETVRVLRELTEPYLIVGTAHVFSDSPSGYYYRYDGHFNAQGSRRIAEFLLNEHSAGS